MKPIIFRNPLKSRVYAWCDRLGNVLESEQYFEKYLLESCCSCLLHQSLLKDCIQPWCSLFKIAPNKWHPYWLAQWCRTGAGTSRDPLAGVAPCSPFKKGECMDLSMDTMHLKDPFVIFGSESSALTLPLFSFHLELLCFDIVLQQWQGTTLFGKVAFVRQCAFKPSFNHVRNCQTICVLQMKWAEWN